MKKVYLLLCFLSFSFGIEAQEKIPTKKELFKKLQVQIEQLKTHDHEASHHHHHGHLPEEARLEKLEMDRDIAKIYMHLPKEYLVNEYNEHQYEDIYLRLFNNVSRKGIKTFKIYVRSAEEPYQPIENYLEHIPYTAPVFKNNSDGAPAINRSQNPNYKAYPHTGQTQSTGALSGKTVWLSPGHGWLYYTSLSDFSTQRGETNDMVEDFGSVEGINYYLMNYLINAGANVWLVRERDLNTNEVIVDNSQAGYSETGTWTTTANTGYTPSTGQVNGANGYRFASTVSGGATSTATWTPNIPQKGHYWVSVLYKAFSDRAVDARYEITHAGGTSTVSINQEVHGETWVYLGRYYFDSGVAGNVKLINTSSDPGQVIIADAVRFGGGTNGGAGSARNITDCTHGTGPTNEARFEESARMYAPYMNYPTCRGDVTMRPNYAEWELAKGTAQEKANAVYVSWHTNAATTTARGTVTYAYDGSNGSYPVTTGSYDLQSFIHNELVRNIKSCWDSGWNDRGVKYANFGELRELSTMPGCLVEVAFHDNATDAQALTTPYFRDLAARGIYQGIVKFFNDRDGSPLAYVPEAPTHLSAVNSGSGQITLNWNAPPGSDCGGANSASGYRVYRSTHGRGFADAVTTSGTSYTFTGLSPNTTYYFRVSGTNTGGESFPTATVAARTPTSGSTVPVLIVDGFDRLDRAGAVRKTSSSQLTDLRRLFLEKMNSYDYMVEHAQSLASCSIAFDGASNEAVIQNDVNLSTYLLVDWYTGEESTVDRSLDATEQSRVQAYLDGGGHLIISGAEIGWDIGRSSSGNANVSFYNNYLKATYNGDDAGTYNLSGTTGSIYSGVSGSFDDNTFGYFNAEFPDLLGATGGSTAVLNYSGVGTGSAAVAYDGADFGVVNFGFPLETITSVNTRNTLICDAVNYLIGDALPVEGLELDGEVKTRGNTLTWLTLSEQNTDYFELQRSHNGFEFKTIHKTEAAGQSLEESRYTYQDLTPYRQSYYRVKVVHLDGSFELSEVIRLERKDRDAVQVFPNPIKNKVSIRFDLDREARAEVLLFDISGRLLIQERVTAGNETIDIDVSTLTPGAYQYTILISGESHSGKLMKL